jgi:hypothetical protein
MKTKIVAVAIVSFIFCLAIIIGRVRYQDYKIKLLNEQIESQKTLLQTKQDVITLLNDKIAHFEAEKPKTTDIHHADYAVGTSSPISTTDTHITEPVFFTPPTVSTTVVTNIIEFQQAKINLLIGYDFDGSKELGVGYTPKPNVTIGIKAREKYAGVWCLLGVK